jgi:hypothetical protein
LFEIYKIVCGTKKNAQLLGVGSQLLVAYEELLIDVQQHNKFSVNEKKRNSKQWNCVYMPEEE